MAIDAPAAPATPAAPAAPAAGEPKGGDPKPGTGTPATPPKPGENQKPGEGTPPATAANRRRVKVEGEEREIDEKDIDALIQKGLSADKRFKEASKYRKDAEMIAELMRTNPMAVLERASKMFGHDARKIVEEWLWKNYIQLESLSPEEKERELERRELEKHRNDAKEREQAEKDRKFEEARQAYHGHYEREIIGALQEGGLPRTPRTVERIAHYLIEARKMGAKIGPKDVVPLVREDYEKEIRELFGPMNGDVLAGLLGDDTLKKLRDHELAKVKGTVWKPLASPKEGEPTDPPTPGGKKKPMTLDEWREDLDRRVPLK